MRDRIRRPGRRTVLLAAALAALLIWGAAALGGDFFRSVSAALVQDLTPIRLSDTDQGIVMSVQSVTEKDGAFHVRIALRDELGDRLREGADLFDVYRSGIRRAVSLTCEPLGFDAGTGSSGLIVVIRPGDGRDLEGEKFTLSVTQLMLGQTVTETVLPVDWGNLPRDHAAMRRKVNQLGWTDGYKPAAFEDGTALLLQPGSLDLPAAPGVTLTAAGFLENRLRLQLRFDGHSPYDQEALTLTAPDGTAYRACAFLYTQAEEGTVYRDAVYDVTPEALTDCVLSGRFATGGQLLQGDWQITFRLDS